MIGKLLETSRLMRPLLFLHIKMDKLCRYVWLYPLFWFGLLSAFLVLFFQGEIGRVSYELVEKSAAFVVLMPEFYLLDLIAVALAIKTPAMDKGLEGGGAALTSRENETGKRFLSRRRFLCLLFGYLSFLSLLLLLSNMALTMVAQGGWFTTPLQVFFAGIYGFFFIQLVLLTMLALFFLCDRLHWTGESTFYE